MKKVTIFEKKIPENIKVIGTLKCNITESEIQIVSPILKHKHYSNAPGLPWLSCNLKLSVEHKYKGFVLILSLKA